MQFSVEEKLMYGAMKAIYDSGIPIDFKGSMVLKVCLIEAGYHEEIRHTVDIDANWYSESPPTAEQMTDSLQNALRRAGIDLDVSLYRMYGEGRSAGFELSEREVSAPEINIRDIQRIFRYRERNLRCRDVLRVRIHHAVA